MLEIKIYTSERHLLNAPLFLCFLYSYIPKPPYETPPNHHRNTWGQKNPKTWGQNTQKIGEKKLEIVK
jgi:hypothetical protein